IDPTSLFNFLLSEWNSGRRVYDRLWADRTDRIQNRLNGLLFSLRRPFDETDVLHGDGMEFYIADRMFDRDLLLDAELEGYSEVAAPLLRSGPGKSSVTLVGRGYRAFIGARELEFGKANDIDFEGNPAFRLILFKPIRGERYRNFELSTSDALLTSGLPGPTGLELPIRITSTCH